MFNSRRRVALLTGLACAILWTWSVGAQKAQKGASKPAVPTPVTASFRCAQGLGCDPADATDRILGDASGPYVGSTTTQQGAYLSIAYDFHFPLQPGMGRYVDLDFSQLVGTPPCVAAKTCRKNFTTVYTDNLQPASVTNPVDATDTELPNGLLSILIGQSAPARFKLNFADPGGRALLWTIRLNASMYPGSGYVSVTRTSGNTWTVEATTSDLAELVATTTSGRQVMTHEGFYQMPFKITITQ